MYHYDHIDDYSDTGDHAEENLTLLCPTDHDKKTRKRLALDEIRRANSAPFNVNRAQTTGEKVYFSQRPPVVLIGGNSFECKGPFAPLLIDGIAPILVRPDEDRRVALDIDLRDRFNLPALIIEANEIQLSVSAWDIEWIGEILSIKSDEKDLLIRLKLDVENNQIELLAGRILCNGVDIRIDETGFWVPGQVPARLEHNWVTGHVGIQIGEVWPNQPKPGLSFQVDRYTSDSYNTSG